jgi:hypothetical protein
MNMDGNTFIALLQSRENESVNDSVEKGGGRF